jgi:isoaspartyl peptidase/L-asparaginase-like protein (Ntn-hydrolase superfamily)
MQTALVGSSNALVGAPVALEILRSGGTALNAVEECIKVVELNSDDHTVGYGGYPNLVGEVELDASIMDGRDRNAGCVGALQGYAHAISVARGVMERLPHLLVVGDGAARLAAELGLDEIDLLTEAAEQTWRNGFEGTPETDMAEAMLSRVAGLVVDPEKAPGTVNVIARDVNGNIASGVSTSGWAWKYPGRLGDSAVIGSGNYCDNRYGAAACTGWGELALRAGTARVAVIAMEAGYSVEQAGKAVVMDVNSLDVGSQRPLMHVVLMGADGTVGGFTNEPAKTYLRWTSDMAAAEVVERTLVPVAHPIPPS